MPLTKDLYRTGVSKLFWALTSVKWPPQNLCLGPPRIPGSTIGLSSFQTIFCHGTLMNSGFGRGTPTLWRRKPTPSRNKHFTRFLSKHETFTAHFSLFRGTQFGKPYTKGHNKN